MSEAKPLPSQNIELNHAFCALAADTLGTSWKRMAVLLGIVDTTVRAGVLAHTATAPRSEEIKALERAARGKIAEIEEAIRTLRMEAMAEGIEVEII